MLDWKPEIRKRLANLNLSPVRESEIVEELSQHLSDRYREAVTAGATTEEAFQSTLAELSDDDLLSRELRKAERHYYEPVIMGTRRNNMIDDLWQDLRYSFRILCKNPGFTAIAILTLGLAIGATSSIFSVVNAVLLKQLPYKDPDKLVLLWGTNSLGKHRQQISFTDLQDWRNQARSFEEMVTYNGNWIQILSGNTGPELVSGMQVSDGYFHLMKAQPLLGRTLLSEDYQNRDDHIVVLSHGLWQRRFGGDPSIIGKTLSLNAIPYTVVGVMPADFHSLPTSLVRTSSELYAPLPNEDSQYDNTRRSWTFLRGIARLKTNASMEQAQAELDVIARQQESRYPDTNTGRSVHLVTLKSDLVRDIKSPLLILQGAIALVVLIACVNLANLLLARLATRNKEIAIRVSLGASRSRLIRQTLTESLLLSVAGGACGLFLTAWGIHALEKIGAKVLPELSDIRLDLRVVAFTGGLSLLTGILFGIAPAMRVSITNLNDALKEGGRSSGSHSGRNRLDHLLVVSEIALSFVLLAGAGLLIESFLNLQRVNPGFDPHNTLSANVSLPEARYPQEQNQIAFYKELIGRLKQLPGVEYAGATSILPESGNFDHVPVEAEGKTYRPGEQLTPDAYRVTPDFFNALSIPLIKGRFFTDQDDANHPPVALINETMARQIWPGDDPIGKRIWSGFGNTKRTIVGVVGDVYQYGLDSEKTMQLYVPHAENSSGRMTLVVRSLNDPAQLLPAIRSEVLSIDKDQPIYEIATMDQVMRDSVAGRRFAMNLLIIFGVSALILAAIGIYGVLSYGVTHRMHEFGIRLALGAQQGDLLRMVLGQGAKLAVVGVVIGLAGAFGLTRLMSSLLFGVSATDPATFIVISAVLIFVALLACYIPARRATRVDPMIALRYE